MRLERVPELGGGCAWRGPVQGLCVLAQGLLAMHHADSGLPRLSPLPPGQLPRPWPVQPSLLGLWVSLRREWGPGPLQAFPRPPPRPGPRQSQQRRLLRGRSV